jgi:NADH:ubiquinone oxidoreductase subunit F (NADH-binding)
MMLASQQFPRLLAGLVPGATMSFANHQLIHGAMDPPEARRAAARHPLILEIESAGLRGHGGAGFPTAAKLAAVAVQKSRPVVVINAMEGESLSGKDMLLIRHLPHLVLDGAIAVAAALHSERILVAFDGAAAGARRAVERAISERPELGTRGWPEIVAVPLTGGYLSGQETALIAALNGKRAMPTLTPPYPFERGVGGGPTFVSNTETFAQVALIVRHGAMWFRGLGSASAPGTRLVTVGGAVARPRVVEMAGGTTVRRLLDATGGVSEPLQGLLLGGYAGTWLPPEAIDLPLDREHLSQHGARLGPGIVFALGESACPVAEVAAATQWLRQQSAGQCGVCVRGLAAISGALLELCGDGDQSGAYGQIERWCRLVSGRGACALPDGAASFVSSALQTFGAQFHEHARHGHCDACVEQRVLPLGDERVRLPSDRVQPPPRARRLIAA